jgi:4-carboxymuconolactone decarboxylase
MSDVSDEGDERDDAGMRVRREVLGDAYVDRATAAAAAAGGVVADFQRFVTDSAWGSVWTRPALDRHTRSCITIALLTALRAEHELPLHVRAGLRNGLTADEIAEVIMHTAVYAGLPAANSAMRIATEVLADPEV